MKSMRNPIPGMLDPRASIRLTPAPLIGDNETPVIFSPSGAASIQIDEGDGAVVLTNVTDRRVFYALLIMERDAHTTIGFLAQYARNYLASRKAAP